MAIDEGKLPISFLVRLRPACAVVQLDLRVGRTVYSPDPVVFGGHWLEPGMREQSFLSRCFFRPRQSQVVGVIILAENRRYAVLQSIIDLCAEIHRET